MESRVMPSYYPYNNVLFSFLHFTARPFWQFYYERASQVLGFKSKGAYKPVTQQRFDDQFNFGRTGSILKKADYHKELYPAEFWNEYILYLQEKGKQDGVDYISQLNQK